MPVVIKIGGSTLDSTPSLVPVLKEIIRSGKTGIVVGGGKENQEAVDKAVARGVTNQFRLDLIGIAITRKNAARVAKLLGIRQARIPETTEKSAEVMMKKGVVVTGGLVPPFSTNAVAALLAEATGSRFVNVTNVDGIYDVDIAARFDRRRAREHFIVDLIAAKVIARSKVETHVIRADPEQLLAAARGEKHKGTVVK
jgi:uridylate kinase